MFKYSLDSVLNLKKQLEEQAKIRLGLAVAKYESEVHSLEVLLQELQEVQDLQQKSLTDVAKLKYVYSFSRVLTGRVKQQEQVVEACSVEVDTNRQEVIGCRFEVKKLERLKHRRLADYNYQEQRQEQTIIDEVATVQFYRQGSKG